MSLLPTGGSTTSNAALQSLSGILEQLVCRRLFRVEQYPALHVLLDCFLAVEQGEGSSRAPRVLEIAVMPAPLIAGLPWRVDRPRVVPGADVEPHLEGRTENLLVGKDERVVERGVDRVERTAFF